MADPFARPTPRVDEQLATLVALQKDTAAQLRSVRRQITETIATMRAAVTELEEYELALVHTYSNREQRIDLLLDERLISSS